MCMLELTGVSYTKDIDHVWHLISFHTQGVQRIIILNILDMQLVGGDANNGTCASVERTEEDFKPSPAKTDRISCGYGRSRTYIVPLGRREDRNIPHTTDLPRPALDLEIWKVDGSRHCIRVDSNTRQGSNQEQAPQQLVSRKKKLYQLCQAWFGVLFSRS